MPSVKDILIFVIKISGILFLVSEAFYNSIIPFIFTLFPVLFLFGKGEIAVKIRKRKEKLKKEFLTEINLLSDYLRSGYSVENALRESEKEMTELYGDESDMVREIRMIKWKFTLNITAEEAFLSFSRRSHVREIREFASVFSIVHRSGGQIREVITEVSNNLAMTFDTEEEIRTALTSKKLEQKIMDIMPLLILYYIKTTSYDLIRIMYDTWTGHLVMTVCLILYIGAYLWSEKILDIRIDA